MIQLDLSYLNTISGGDKAFINDMLKMFLTTTFPEMEMLKKHASDEAWELFGSAAHKMKAPIQMLGVPVVSDLILDLELIGKHRTDIDTVPSKVQELEGYIQELERQITAIIQA